MSQYIPEELIDDLRHRADIIEIIREYVPLKKKGQNYTGLCPFHAEKTPSFVVSPYKQIYHCFGCGKGGNVFSFLMEKNGMSFPEVVAFLAKRYGVELPTVEVSPEKAKQNSLLKRYAHINVMATAFYQGVLRKPAGKEAFSYLIRRGLDGNTMEKFLLGYAPQAWDSLSRFLLDSGISPQELITLGLAVKSKKGSLVDRFRNRIIFPIMDESGKIIGFGGRVMDETQPKYLNSPDTPLFQKGRFLYGLHLAKNTIRMKDQAIVMEGYMDVITAHKNGVTQTVAALGTALTEAQAKLLMRYTYNINTCFDADAAGQGATMRSLDLLQRMGCQIAVISIPGAKDPDEFIREQGESAFTSLVQKAFSLFEYKMLKLVEKHSIQTTEGKIKVIQALIQDLNKVQSPVARQGYIQMMSQKLAFPEDVIYAELKRSREQMKGETVRENIKEIVKLTSGSEKAQKNLIRILMQKPDIYQEIEKWGGIQLFSNRLLREIYQGYYLIRQAGHNIKANELISLLKDREAQSLLAEVLLEEEIPQDWERVLQDCILLLRLEVINNKINENNLVMSQYEKKGDISKSREIMLQIQELIKEKQTMASTLRRGVNNLENGKRN